MQVLISEQDSSNGKSCDLDTAAEPQKDGSAAQPAQDGPKAARAAARTLAQ
jgi:hypothetical protein